MPTADTGATQRLFIAVAVPEETRNGLRSLQRDLPRHFPKCRPSAAFHLTLRFLGETPVELAASVRAALRSVKAQPFDLAVQGLGLFGRGAQGVLWAGLKPCPGLAELKLRIDTALAGHAAFPVPQGRFTPHVTLARLKGAPSSVLQSFVTEHGAFALPDFPVTSFGLYSSVLAPGGAVHALEEEYPLA